MTYGICNLSLIPARAKPADKSEMVTQILFGEHFEILESKENWCLVQLAYDGYECWIDKKQCFEITKSAFKELNNNPAICSLDHVDKVVRKSDNAEILTLAQDLRLLQAYVLYLRFIDFMIPDIYDYKDRARHIPPASDPILLLTYL